MRRIKAVLSNCKWHVRIEGFKARSGTYKMEPMNIAPERKILKRDKGIGEYVLDVFTLGGRPLAISIVNVMHQRTSLMMRDGIKACSVMATALRQNRTC